MTVLIPFAGLTPVPWKNGGGSTTEIAIGPPDSGFEDFDWRVSLATIEKDGTFSQFPGVDRTLALVEGHGMLLDIDGDPVLVTDGDPVIAFDGSSNVTAKLSRGGSTDFNAMTRSDRCYHTFGRRRLTGISTFVARADITVLFLAEGEALELRNEKERIGLVRFDAVVLEAGSVWKLEAGQAMIYIVDVYYHSEEDEESYE
ncbi:HutD/Ves family protein [Telluria aromaticivorans]|uniref:HutD family protein n=1 Tax=Telluria aromaticivorans TaxID=2725995 RepID=A0A7Y2K246_9BURK|nr:HutD family protein [Telluria aromaticivorans]NNG25261.1 HutD family protein [Telluria aromaticivorans]